MKTIFLGAAGLAVLLFAAVGASTMFPDISRQIGRKKPEIAVSESAPDCPFGSFAGIRRSPLQRGASLYAQHCASCHGAGGAGDGALAALVHPLPRNFTAGMFKLRSTASGTPTDEDLYGVLTNGMGGGSMPSFAFLPEESRRDLVEYVKQLSRKEEGGKTVAWFEETPAGSSIPVPGKPLFDAALAAAGREVYAKMDCANCHGPEGLGDGPQSAGMKDSWGGSTKPRNLREEPFIGGDSADAIYHRIAAGIGGTTMLAYPDSRLPAKDRWALVAWIRAMREEAGTLGKGMPSGEGGLVAKPSAGPLPARVDDPAWAEAEPRMMALNPTWRAGATSWGATVRALHDGKEIAFLLEWGNGHPVSRERDVQDYTDRAALQFGMKERPGFIGMGDPLRPVNLWLWHPTGAEPGADRKAFVAASHPGMKADLYPDAGNLYASAEMAGNPAAALEPHRFEEANAQGPGTLTLQKQEEQGLSGDAGWKDGVWRLVLRRAMAPGKGGDADLTPGRRVPFAVAVWDGRNDQRGGQKNVSTWHTLEIRP